MNTEDVRINQEIISPEVLLISDEGKSLGVTSIDQALYLAYEKGLDLVEVSSSSKPPVCKLQDYSKYRYELEKQSRLQKAKGKAPEFKEIRLSAKIGDHDFQVKANRAIEFLSKGSRVRVFLQLKGREMIFQEKAYKILEKFKEFTEAEFEQAPTKLGNRFFAVIKKRKENAKIENQ